MSRILLIAIKSFLLMLSDKTRSRIKITLNHRCAVFWGYPDIALRANHSIAISGMNPLFHTFDTPSDNRLTSFLFDEELQYGLLSQKILKHFVLFPKITNFAEF